MMGPPPSKGVFKKAWYEKASKFETHRYDQFDVGREEVGNTEVYEENSGMTGPAPLSNARR